MCLASGQVSVEQSGPPNWGWGCKKTQLSAEKLKKIVKANNIVNPSVMLDIQIIQQTGQMTSNYFGNFQV